MNFLSPLLPLLCKLTEGILDFYWPLLHCGYNSEFTKHFRDTMQCRVFWKLDDHTNLFTEDKGKKFALGNVPNGHGGHCDRVDAEHFLKFLNDFYTTLGEHSKSPPLQKTRF